MRVYAFEGLMGSGKSLIAAGTAKALRSRGWQNVYSFHTLADTELGRGLRSLANEYQPSKYTYLLMTLAARNELIETTLKPMLLDERSEGAGEATVLIDRWTDSTIAYQGSSAEYLARDVVGGGYPWSEPTTFYLNASLEVCRERRQERGVTNKHEADEEWASHYYTQLILRKPTQYIILDATLPAAQTIDLITNRIIGDTAWA